MILGILGPKRPACAGLGAEDGARTRDLNLGKVALYQLSYFRRETDDSRATRPAKRDQRPLEPNPPAPRPESSSRSTSTSSTSGSAITTSWAIRSPRWNDTAASP